MGRICEMAGYFIGLAKDAVFDAGRILMPMTPYLRPMRCAQSMISLPVWPTFRYRALPRRPLASNINHHIYTYLKKKRK
jgi:hypothetical protein